MKKLMALLLLLLNVALAQENQAFLTDFLFEDELTSGNQVKSYASYDFAELWMKTDNRFVYGIIGEQHQRLHLKFLSIEKNPFDPLEYVVRGKSKVKGTTCEFLGVIRLKEVRTVQTLHYGIDDAYKDKGIRKQGVVIAEYEFRENEDQFHSGFFKGMMYTKWYLDAEQKLQYDNIQFGADGYMNNACIGTWTSYKTEKQKICNWGDHRVPEANDDFDIGAAEFSVSEKYIRRGWTDVVLMDEDPSPTLVRKKSGKAEKSWWED